MIKHCLFRTEKIGTGTFTDPWRSVAMDFIDTDLTEGTGKSILNNPARNILYGYVWAEEADLDLLEADSRATRISPRFDTRAGLRSWFNGLASGLSVALRNQLDADGYSVSWLRAATTKKQMFRYMMSIHTLAQKLNRLGRREGLDVLGSDLDNTVSSVSAIARQRVKDWMERRNLDTSWIQGSTTIRAVLHNIVTNVDFSRFSYFQGLRI